MAYSQYPLVQGISMGQQRDMYNKSRKDNSMRNLLNMAQLFMQMKQGKEQFGEQQAFKQQELGLEKADLEARKGYYKGEQEHRKWLQNKIPEWKQKYQFLIKSGVPPGEALNKVFPPDVRGEVTPSNILVDERVKGSAYGGWINDEIKWFQDRVAAGSGQISDIDKQIMFRQATDAKGNTDMNEFNRLVQQQKDTQSQMTPEEAEVYKQALSELVRIEANYISSKWKISPEEKELAKKIVTNKHKLGEMGAFWMPEETPIVKTEQPVKPKKGLGEWLTGQSGMFGSGQGLPETGESQQSFSIDKDMVKGEFKKSRIKPTDDVFQDPKTGTLYVKKGDKYFKIIE